MTDFDASTFTRSERAACRHRTAAALQTAAARPDLGAAEVPRPATARSESVAVLEAARAESVASWVLSMRTACQADQPQSGETTPFAMSRATTREARST